ncbi:MAG TPA: hypothetical protein VFH33_00035, partial [Candidatus Krumholzibacteria bacterium]|nr:hypothetical protein [Candidatus Krumholzibacteria bacterium]
MRLLFGIVLVIFVLGIGSPAVAQQYANAVAQWYPGAWDVYSLDLVTSSPCVTTTRALDLNDILGAPNG